MDPETLDTFVMFLLWAYIACAAASVLTLVGVLAYYVFGQIREWVEGL